MKKKRFSAEQIVAILKQAELGTPVVEMISQVVGSVQTFYRWKKKYSGLEVDQVRKVKQVREENVRLKRLYKEEGLGLKQRPKRRRRTAEHRRERVRPTRPNQVWSLDFVADQLTNGRRFRVLTTVDVFTRESLAVEVGPSLKGTQVVEVLNRIRAQRGAPRMLFCDNGSEFSSQIMDLWAYQNGGKIDFSQPGKPTDSAYIESFNETLRAECLDTH